MIRDFLKFLIFSDSILKTVPICGFALKINSGHIKLVNEKNNLCSVDNYVALHSTWK